MKRWGKTPRWAGAKVGTKVIQRSVKELKYQLCKGGGETRDLGRRTGWHKGYPEVELRVKVSVLKRWGENPKLGGHTGWHKGDPEAKFRVNEPVMKWWRRTPRLGEC